MAERKGRRREKKSVPKGKAYIQSTFNNTLITLTDPNGNVIAAGSAGNVGFKGSRKSTPFAATQAAERAAKKAMEHGLRQVDVLVKGPGAGREAGPRRTGVQIGSRVSASRWSRRRRSGGIQGRRCP